MFEVMCCRVLSRMLVVVCWLIMLVVLKCSVLFIMCWLIVCIVNSIGIFGNIVFNFDRCCCVLLFCVFYFIMIVLGLVCL